VPAFHWVRRWLWPASSSWRRLGGGGRRKLPLWTSLLPFGVGICPFCLRGLARSNPLMGKRPTRIPPVRGRSPSFQRVPRPKRLLGSFFPLLLRSLGLRIAAWKVPILQYHANLFACPQGRTGTLHER
jgi:hypothetical protein